MTRTHLAIIVAALAGSGCFFPEFTFDEDGAGGQSPTTTTASSTDATTDASTTSSSAGGGEGGTGGAGGSPPIDLEDCTNGVDDDADTTVDCADVGCASKAACVAPVPADWTGFFALYEGPAGGFTGCPSAFPTLGYQGNADLVAPDATCSMCTCNAPTGRNCVLPTILAVRDAACGLQSTCSGNGDVSVGWTGPCEGTGYFAGGQTTCGANTTDCASPNTGVACNQAVTMAAAQVVGGTCTPVSATSTPTTTESWSTLGVACGDPAMTALGCNSTFTCLPKPDVSAGYVAGLCISHPGVEPCPVGTFSEQHIFYTAFTDDRDCSGCSCPTGSVGGTCSATVNVFSDLAPDTCTSSIATLNVTSAAAACTNLTGNPNVSGHSATINPPTGGGCPPMGGDPTGSADPDATTATTFCCRT